MLGPQQGVDTILNGFYYINSKKSKIKISASRYRIDNRYFYMF
jgi:hypothetical protein